MTRRWLGLIAFTVLFLWARGARADFTSSPSPVAFDNVAAGSSKPIMGMIFTDQVTEQLDSIEAVGAGCARFTFTPTGTAPWTVAFGVPLNYTATFNPIGRGALTCTINFKTGMMVKGTVLLTGTGVGPVITTSPAATVVFANTRVANAAVLTANATVRISNTGDTGQNLSVTALTIGGTNGSDFTIPSPPTLPATIPPGMFLDVSVQFNPSNSGLRVGTLDIASNDPATPTKQLALNGTGTNAVIGVTDVPFGIVSGGSIGSNTSSVTNTAAAPQGTLTVASATITQSSTWFTFDANGSGCAGQTSCNFAALTAPGAVTLRCSPPLGASGTQNASVTFTSDTDNGGDDIAMLSCTAGRPDIMVAPLTMTFADQLANTTSTAMQLVITNTGNAPLHYSVAKTGGQPAAFILSGGCTSTCTLGAGLMSMINVQFNPNAPGAFSTTLSVTSDDPDAIDMNIPVAVSGNGIAPQIAMNPTSLDFMSVELGQTASLTLTASNTGGAPLNITSSTLTSGGADYTITTGTTGAQTVAAGGMTTWTIRCNPSAVGSRPGNFRIVSNSFTGATTNVGLTCTGLQGSLATTPATTPASPLDFGGVTVGNTGMLTFTLRNPGNVTVTGIAGVLGGTGTGYSIDPSTPIPTTLAAGQVSSPITVRFSPTVGTDGGAATITITGMWGTAQTAMVVVHLQGDGLTAGYDVQTIPTSTPPVLDFGSIRYDQTATAAFCIINTDQTPVAIQTPIAIAVNAPTVASELTVTQVRRNATCSTTGGAAVTLPQTLTQGQILVVTVRMDPNNRTGLISGMATVTSDLGTNPTRTVGLTGMSTTAMISTTPGLLVDLGSVDRDGPPATTTVTITNTGTAALDLSGFARAPLTGPFTFTLPVGAQNVPVGGHIDIGVTYTPTVEQAPGVFEQVVISHNIAGVLAGPASQMITVRGRGIDRHIALDAAPVFPDTFRNPGSKAPMMPVRVRNTGQASLNISAVMITNSDVWDVVDPNPVVIPSQGMHDFQVRFVPKVAGKAPVGTLVFMNNDNTVPAPVATVLLDGYGLDRNVVMTDSEGGPTIDLGLTGIGIPATLPEGLTLRSRDDAHEFTIRAITIDDDLAFAIVDSPVDRALPASTTMKFDVTFTPTVEGPFETKAFLYLDEDPVPTTEVTLKGNAVFVDVTGSGGCASGAGGGLGTVALVLGALLLRRRRTAALLALALLALPATGRADAELDLSLFNPTPSTTGNGFQVQPASVGDNGQLAATATVSYATNPLVLKFAGSEHMSITQRTTMELGAAYAFLDRFEAGVRMPLYNQSGDGTMVGVASPSGTARGDLVLHGKARLAAVATGGSQLLAGAMLSLTLPTATSEEFAGVAKPTGRVLGVVTFTPGALKRRLAVSANLGAVLRSKATLSNIEQGSGLAWGVGASFRTLDQLWTTVELYGDVVPGGRKDSAMGSSSALAVAEILGGFSYRPDPRFALGLAVGRGVIAGIGTPDLRGVVSLSFVPGTRELPPIHPPPPPKIDGDADGDGVKDSADRCPEQAEDKDMFDDTDGCPDPDNDGDGFIDQQDMCPLDAEDKDSFQDDDGCPEKDNDQDAIPDTQDKCPNLPEDKDGSQDIDGCPDPDNDLDGMFDAQDMCPNEPETINGNQDDDGCPDRGDALIVVTPSALETVEAVQFTGKTVSKNSANVLGQLAATLRAHQEIVRLKIIAHVQPSGDDDKDQELSEKRALAVRDWLVQWGIPQNRLSAMGVGGKKPLVPAKSKGAQLINDRIELIILERK